MAETLLSPGVLARENDQSFITSQPVEVGAAILGPSVKGPVGIPTLVTSYSDYLATFGGSVMSGSTEYSYLTSVAADNYFKQGGVSLLVTRVVADSNNWESSFTSASIGEDYTENFSYISQLDAPYSESFSLATISEGALMNNYDVNGDSTGGTLASGSSDNIRWEITSVNKDNGTFSLLVRKGNDKTNEKSVLETFTNLSLDPKAPNYIEKEIGNTYHTVEQDGTDFYVKSNGTYTNKSKYIRVKSVNLKTPDYFDNNGTAKSEYTGSLPRVGSGSFDGGVGDLFNGEAKFNEAITATDIQGLSPLDYDTSIALLGNKDEYKFNILAAPGLIHSIHATQVNALVSAAEARQDCIAVIDLRGYNSTITQVTAAASSFDSSYAATYWPWLQVIDSNTAQTSWVPTSTMIPGVFAFTDKSSDPWFAPAGLTRGGLGQVIKAERKLTSGNRDSLYTANVNPIATFPGTGVVVFGQKTLQKKASALDRVNVRRLLIALKSYISQVSDNLVFEQNTIATRNSFLTQVNPYLESVQQRQGLYAFKVVMDETNNTAAVVDRNQLVGQIYLQPTKTAEYIVLDFNVLPTGATFPA
jgi:hypothetical protein